MKDFVPFERLMGPLTLYGLVSYRAALLRDRSGDIGELPFDRLDWSSLAPRLSAEDQERIQCELNARRRRDEQQAGVFMTGAA
jgi:hypothetical protein